jgi:DNA-binding transcriptional LysR family regulator
VSYRGDAVAKDDAELDDQRPAPLPDARSALNFRQLEVFHAVISAGSVSAASRLLNTSQPSLSRSVRRLEDVLRFELFTRSSGRLVATFEALELFRDVDQIVRRVAGLDTVIERIVRGATRVFRLGASPSVSRRVVPRALRVLADDKPELEYFLDSLSMPDMTDYLVTGRGECVVTIFPIAHPLIETERLGTGMLQALIPADHPLARRQTVKVTDLSDVDLIGFEANGPHALVIDSLLSQLPRKPRIKALVRFSEAATVLVDEGLGIALVDSFSAMGPLGPNVVVRSLADAPTFPLLLLTNIERPRTQHVKALATALRNLCNSMP